MNEVIRWMLPPTPDSPDSLQPDGNRSAPRRGSLGLHTVGTHSWGSHCSCRRSSKRRLFGDDEDEATAYFCSHRKFKNNMLMSAFPPTETSMARLKQEGRGGGGGVTHPASLCQGDQKKSPSRAVFLSLRTERGTATSVKQFDTESDDTR